MIDMTPFKVCQFTVVSVGNVQCHARACARDAFQLAVDSDSCVPDLAAEPIESPSSEKETFQKKAKMEAGSS
jgi:hypothetical protein